ncbi:recombinase family protein [Nordella sp. HKS 07]|nr:recombinase family protein [Nordella sp. HKS 07]
MRLWRKRQWQRKLRRRSPIFGPRSAVGQDKDSDKRQRAAIAAFAKREGFALVDEFRDEAVSGADAIEARPGFAASAGPHRRQWRADCDRRGCQPVRASYAGPGARRRRAAGARRPSVHRRRR